MPEDECTLRSKTSEGTVDIRQDQGDTLLAGVQTILVLPK